jgi:hypothetical protein
MAAVVIGSVLGPGGLEALTDVGDDFGEPSGLPCGPYEFLSKGLTGILFINSIDNHGKINGSLFGHDINDINGSWDQTVNKVAFRQTVMSGSNQSVSYEYTGFYHNICSLFSLRNTSHCVVITGSAVPKTVAPDQAAKQEFGWIAIAGL